MLLWEIVGFVTGFACCWLMLLLRKRVVAYNQFVSLKNQLAAFVASDLRIAGLYPPSYLVGESSGTADYVSSAGCYSLSAWESMSDADQKYIQKNISIRIGKMANETADLRLAAALKYTLEKSGKMVRSRLVVLLARFLKISEESKFLKIAQIVELEHCASLLHDDVVDEADMRRGVPSHRKLFGDRIAVLAGDNLISLLVDVLAEVDDMHVTGAIARSIEGLVVGELLQLVEGGVGKTKKQNSSKITFRIEHYLRKSYFKTASLFAAIGECVGWCCGDSVCVVTVHLSRFGYFFGMAFQLVDDLLDFDGNDAAIGKPGNGADIRNGTATLPVLHACIDEAGLNGDERKELTEMVFRRFKMEGDCERTLELVRKSNGIPRTRKLVCEYFRKCRIELDAIAQKVPTDSRFRDALIGLLQHFETRTS